MNKKVFITLCALIVGGGVVSAFVFLPKLSTSSPSSTSGAIKAGMKLGKYHQIVFGNNKVVVGDENGSSISSKVELSKWDEEIKFGISYPTNGKPITEDNKITWKDKDRDVYLKIIPKKEPQAQAGPTKVQDNGILRYISIKDASLKDVAASYQIFNKTRSSQPSILGVAIKEAGYVFFGDRDVELDIKNPRSLSYPMVRIRTEDEFSCPVIPTAADGTFAIFFYYPEIKTRGDEIKDMLVASVNASLEKYGQKNFVKRKEDFLYYVKGLQIKPLGRIATDKNTIGLNIFVKTPYETGLKDHMRLTFQLLRDKYVIPTGGLQELNSKITPSIVEEIIPRFASTFKEKLEKAEFTAEETAVFNDLKNQQTKDYVIANSNKETPIDKFEFDITLKEKPKDNVFTYNIETDGLDFFYQPPLTEKEKDAGFYQPENATGSYAVYKKDVKNSYDNKEEAENYKTGKVMHIYRPKIIDSKNNWTWGTLNIDQGKGTLSVTVDKEFLATAYYPVIIDPTFGYTTIGASYNSLANVVAGSYFTMPESGNVTGISAYADICFTENTLVSMANGTFKKIKEVKSGEKVKSYDEKTKRIVEDIVGEVIRHPADEMGEYYIVIQTYDGKKVEVTPNHPIYRNGKWVAAEYIKTGDLLLNDENKDTQVILTQKVYKQVSVYNLGVIKNHNYFTNFLVHNKKVVSDIFMKTAIYRQSDNTQVAGSNEIVTQAISQQWRDFSVSASLNASTNYWLYFWSNGVNGFYYDTGGNGASKSLTYGTWPDPLTGQTPNTYRYSIYATYTAGEAPTATPTPYKAGLKGSVKLRGAVKMR